MAKAIAAPRRGYIDALKGLGIILVVLGHFEEFYRGTSPVFNGSFECIYMFHMALFCLCSGLVAKWNLKKYLLQQVWLYLLCQGMLLPFRVYVLGENLADTGGPLMALLLPWRHMWYLLALLLWELTVPLLTLLRTRWGAAGRAAGMAVALALGLGSGYFAVPDALSRLLPFYPFYAFGVLFRQDVDLWCRTARRRPLLRWLPALTALAVYAFCFFSVLRAPEPIYESARIWQNTVYAGNHTPVSRAAFYLIGISTTLVLAAVLGDCPPLASLGRRTLPVYVFHMPVYAFLVELGVFGVANEKGSAAVAVWLFLAVGGCVCLCASAPVHTVFSWLAGLWYKTLPALWDRSRS